jgi:IS605 OrfB family transposase
MPTVTRKIELAFDVEDKAELKDLWKKVYNWNFNVRQAANYLSSHLWIQQHIKDLFYVTDGVKSKLANITKDPDGILITSKDNTTYQVLSKKYKGEMPMGMLSGLNTVIAKTYAKEANDVNMGLKSLRTYRQNIPLPIRTADISQWQKLPDGNYSFFVYGTRFKTYFGLDLSFNEIMMDRAVGRFSYKHPQLEKAEKQNRKRKARFGIVIDENNEVEYKFCDSTLTVEERKNKEGKKKNKIFLNAVFSFDSMKRLLDSEKVAECFLSEDYPIVIKESESRLYYIGTKQEYQHRRQAIRSSLDRLKKDLKYGGNGDGRRLKLQALDRFEALEKKYVNFKMHKYSKVLIDYCLKRGIGTIRLNNYKEIKEKLKQDTAEAKLLLSSWSYFSLSEKIKYKSAVYGIAVEIPE